MSLPKLRFKDDSRQCFPDWETKRLLDLAKVYDGTHMTPDYKESGVPFFSVEHLTNNNFCDTKFISEEIFDKENKRVKLEKGDILMTRIGDIGTPKYIDWDVRASFYVSLALIKQSKNINSQYLSHFITTPYFQKELHQRTIHVAFPKKINLGEISECLVHFPSEPEQTKIANFLTAVDEKITQLTQKHDLLTQYKKGVMQQIFSQELRFKNEDEQNFPDWEKLSISEIFHRNTHSSKTEYIVSDGNFIIVDMGSISREAKLLSTKNTNFTNDFLTTNDLVMAKDDIGGGNIIGRVVQIPENNKYICSDHVYKLTLKQGYVSYFYYAINSFKVNKSFRQKANGTAQIGISNKTVDVQEIPVPSLKEQTKIANFLTAIDDKITANQTQLQAVKQYKQGLLQQMFV